MEDLTGHLLIAAAEMEDPHFARTVILMIRHSPEEGAMGLVLNRPLSVEPQEIFAGVESEIVVPPDVSVRWGGPVQGPLIVLHTVEELGDLVVMPNVCITTQRDRVLELLRLERRPFHFYLGYSGWGKRQLEGEFEAGGWHSATADASFFFHDPYDMWTLACQQVGWDVLRVDPRVGNQRPIDPNRN